MITLLPTFQETIVLSRTAEEIYGRLFASTSQKPFLQPDEHELLFSGWATPERFRLSLRSRRPSHFLPLVSGTLESTSFGCILFLRFSLFPATRMLLQLWSVLIIIGTLMIAYPYESYTSIPVGLLVLASIHLIAWSNFRIHLRPTREAIQRAVT